MTVASGTLWFGARLAGRSSAGAKELVDRADYRLALLGGLLPDLIDKPIGWIILREQFDANGHLWGHTILAALALLVPGIMLIAHDRDPRLATIGLAMLSHLAVDPVNHSPESLLWPLMGTDFPKISLLGREMTILTETISALLLLGAAISLHRNGRLRQFLSTGRTA